MQRLARDALLEHMEDNNLFTKYQHGFRKGRSCTTQLLETLEDWTMALDESETVDVIYLDNYKAFDKVSHRRLLYKLKSYGVGGVVWKWIQAFLQDLKQQVVINGSKSSQTSVTSGISQGSVIGPILFLIYINDFPDQVLSSTKLFADNSNTYRRVGSREDQELLQKENKFLTNIETRLKKLCSLPSASTTI